MLKKNNGNIEACEEEFHDKRIKEICEKVDCDKDKATRFYRKFNLNKEKAIYEINNEQKVLTIENKKVAKNTIGFVLWFEDENGEQLKTIKRNDIFIPTEDFDFIKEEFESNCSENFDETADNCFSKEDSKSVIKAIEKIETDNENQTKFLSELVNPHYSSG